MNHALHRERIHKLRYRILALAGATLVTGGALTWGLYETGLLTQEIQKTPEDILVEKLLQEPEIEHFNRASREFHDYYSRMFVKRWKPSPQPKVPTNWSKSNNHGANNNNLTT